MEPRGVELAAQVNEFGRAVESTRTAMRSQKRGERLPTSVLFQ
jgi:hypothetical protein